MSPPDLVFLAGSSSGGELTELLELLRLGRKEWPIFPNHFVSTQATGAKDLSEFGPAVFLLNGATRTTPMNLLLLLFDSFRLAFKLKPKILITTGSLPLAMLAFWSYLFGAKIIWIECSASLDSLSWSGRFASYFAERFYVQHPCLANSSRIYVGELA